MKKYKALITDLDGSAVSISSNGSEIGFDTITGVRSALERGHIIACATGRGWMLARSVIKALELRHPCIIEGGTRIIDPVTEKTLWEKGIPDRSAADVVAIFQQYAPEGIFVSSDRDRLSPEERLAWGSRLPKAKDIVESPKGVRYLYLLALKSEQAVQLINTINKQEEVVAHMTPSWQGEQLLDVHVTHREATKEHAIVQWRTMLGISKEECIGFGDSGNDIPIFEAVGLRVAAESGAVEIKELADYIAPGPENNGLAHVIGKFLHE